MHKDMEAITSRATVNPIQRHRRIVGGQHRHQSPHLLLQRRDLRLQCVELTPQFCRDNRRVVRWFGCIECHKK